MLVRSISSPATTRARLCARVRAVLTLLTLYNFGAFAIFIHRFVQFPNFMFTQL